MCKLRVRGIGPAALVALVLVSLWLLAAPGSSHASSFTRGFADSVWEQVDNPSQTTGQWARNVYASGGRIAEVEIDWGEYEPHAPATGSSASSPANPAYTNWAQLDTTVETLESAGVEPMFLVTSAPGWAQAKRGSSSTTEAYEPNDNALRAFVRALATRYDGRYPNPALPGRSLPRVRYYQAWAEANLTIKLAPQWKRVHRRWDNIGAAIYRGMLNAFYAGVKVAEPSDTVIFTGLEAYGDAPGGQRVQPVTFLENVLCLNAKLQKVCNTSARFDVLASDPYEVGSPTTRAINADDASAPDLSKLTTVLKAAVSAGTALPDRAKALWVTEFGYDSKPPNPYGVSAATQARWLEQSLYVFWTERVSTVLWYLIRDEPGVNYGTSYYSGVYFYDGKKKPSYTAYQFPLVVAAHGGGAQIWGIAPVSGQVRVQMRETGQWKTIETLHAAAGVVFDALTAIPSPRTRYRAVEGSHRSLTWSY